MTTNTLVYVYLKIIIYKLYIKVCVVPLTKGKYLCGSSEAELIKVYVAVLKYVQPIYVTSIIINML